MLNPFFLYSGIWSFVLVIYNFYFSNLQVQLTQPIIVFLLITIIVSGLLGYIFKDNFKFTFYDNLSIKHCGKFVFLLLSLHIVEFIYEGHIPLFGLINKTVQYQDYEGLPFFHVLIVTFNIFYAIHLIYLYTVSKDKKIFMYYVLTVLMLLLIYSRSNIMIVMIASIQIIMMKQKMTRKFKICIGVLGVFLLYLFGFLGNVRIGHKWNDNSYILTVGQMKEDNLLPDTLSWSYLYLVTPISNLEYNFQNKEIDANIKTFVLESIIPDFISKRIPHENSGHMLVNSGWNVSTGYINSYSSLGVLGMYIQFVYYCIVNISIMVLVGKKSPYFTTTISLLSTLMSLTFFVNPYTFSGWSFALIFPIIASINFKFQIFETNKNTIKNFIIKISFFNKKY